ncbi:NO-inducible flavohemoprotein [Metabacillus elymi]|uniref:Flavohemoprotein n=1 Tax=Metabacillus elymi TaxID=2745198 RepID=A0ABX6S1C6_9BACI|nr:NO-inducible flavohemoprotein [Metabacillus sp. KUDC1714]QNF27038.1 NO-inducible flavohemoprotein [Metabacillus sp. KUDC1714]
MLSPEKIAIIKSTVPVLEKHGVEITTRFYQLLFESHPELLNVFNQANQKRGRQQTALANAVYAAASHIENLGEILDEVKLIAHKHRSLGIKPEQYPIVGENLLKAIKDVLGDAATDEIIDAWSDAYNMIADAFIGIEADLYQQASEQPGGWKDFRKFVVDRKVEESSVITSFYLKPKDQKEIAQFIPGQYISVKVEVPDEKYTQIREYSLSDSPGKNYYRISVKSEDEMNNSPEGVVSNYLHSKIQEGDTIEISAPAGVFTLDTNTNQPVVLISGGVGVTPLMSMLNSLVDSQSRKDIYFIHSAINSEYHAFKDHVEKLSSEHDNIKSFVCYEKPTEDDQKNKNYDKEGYLDLNWLHSILPSNEASFYFCGPIPFMKAVYGALKQWQVSEEHIHYEFFGPAGTLEGDGDFEPALDD